MTVAYDGSGFHGFAINRGVPTVAGALSDALERVLGHPVELACAGRTDRGVHALGQVVSFGVGAGGCDLESMTRSVNRMCGPRIAVSQAEFTDSAFDARFSCTGRVYRYLVLNSPVGNPLLAGFCWHVERPLDFSAMRAAGARLVGEHDFSSLCRRASPDQSLVRTVRRAVWRREGGLATFEIEARAFCHQMVRSAVGLLVVIGMGRRPASSVDGVLAARDRSAAPPPAPPHGLVMWRALYSN